MEIVIKLPEATYKVAKDACRLAGCPKDWEALFLDVFWAIGGGRVLPKGHGRLIDADAFKDKITRQRLTFRNVKEYTEMMLRINDAPTIIKADGGDAE